jgi:formate hydrogenlyase subunit 3/multisubunit Na+/H+ antiporter MnhD subunit
LITNSFHLYFLFFFYLVLHFVYIETSTINTRAFNFLLYYLLWVCVSTYYFCVTSSLIVFFFMYESIQFPAIYILYFLTKTARALCAALLMGFWTLIGAFFLLIAFSYLICILDIYTFADYECNVALVQTQAWWYARLLVSGLNYQFGQLPADYYTLTSKRRLFDQFFWAARILNTPRLVLFYFLKFHARCAQCVY